MSKRVFAIAGIVVLCMLLIAGIGGFFYYRSLKGDAAVFGRPSRRRRKRDDKTQIDSLVDMDAVVEDFLPQITGKAVELYGRGLVPGRDREALALPRRSCRR